MRASVATIVVGLVLVSAVSLAFGWKTGSPYGAWIAAVATLVAPIAAIATKLSARRTIEIADASFWLDPMVGERRSGRVRRVVAAGEDIVVQSECGRVFVLGVLGGHRQSELARRTLVAGLTGDTEKPKAGR